MKTIAAGQFKQICLRLLDEVGESGEPILITKRDKPVAQLVPVRPERADDWRGAMHDRGEIHADLLPPALDSAEWNALRE